MCREPARDTERLVQNIQEIPYESADNHEQRIAALQYAVAHLKIAAAGGMDMWPVQAVKLMPKAQTHLLCAVYDVCVQYAMWPTMLLNVRTHLVPKRTAEKGMLGVQEWRPLAISSVWLRLWAKWQLLQQHSMLKALDPRLVGGLPGRCAVTSMVELLLNLEEAENQGDQYHLLSLDAVKCFDKVDIPHALAVGKDLGMTREALRGHAAYLRDHQRVLTANGYVDQVGWHPTNGLLQGDPLSVLLCVACVDQWIRRVAPSGASMCAYIDDRTLHAPTMHALQDAWARSQLWDGEHGWEVNFKKTQYLKVGPDCAYLETPMGVLPPTPSLCLLGYDILAHGRFAMAKMETRITEVKTTAIRMARTPLPPWIMKQVVAVALLPKLAFGPHPCGA